MSFESRLRKETARWVTEGVVSAEQAERILALHPEQEGSATSRFLTIISVLGGVLCVVGLALIISANWQDIHRWVKIIVAVLLLAGSHAAGYWLKWGRGHHPKMGDALLMAGCVLFLLGIALISQIFHLGGRPGDAVLVWAVGIAPIPFLTRSRAAFFVLLLAIYSWLVIESTVNDGLLNLAVRRSYSAEVSFPFVLLCGSLVLYWTAFFWRETWRSFARIQQAWPVAVICVMVYAAGFAHKSWWGQRDELLAGPAALLAGLAIAAGVAAAWRDWNEWRMLSPWLVLAAGGALLALGNFFGDDVRMATSVLSWITLIVLNVFMARAGLGQGRPWLVNLAIAFIALNLFTRYFDIFGTMLNQGLMFLVSGVVVLGLGWFLERKRRALIGAIRRGGAA
jgi:uncharacterized membrane protein